MPEACQPTGNEQWTGDWEYAGCHPDRVVEQTTPSGVRVGIAMIARYVWRRRFAREFVCCRGDKARLIWVDGNYAIETFERYDAGYPVIRVSVSLPVPDWLQVVTDALGLTFEQEIAWGSKDQVDGERPSDPDPGAAGNGIPVLTPPPQADCGERIVTPDGETHYWWSGELGRPEANTPPPQSSVPRITYDPVDKPCCSQYSGRALAPTLTVIRHEMTRSGPTFSVNVRLEWNHPCGLDGSPEIVVLFFYPGRPGLEVPPLSNVAKGTTDQGRKAFWQLDSQMIQIPLSYRGGGLVVRYIARSKCGAVSRGDHFLARA